MSGRRIEDVLKQLVPLESYRSPTAPTLSLDTPAVVGIVGPRALSERGPDEPSHWFALDPGRDDLLAFARTTVISPVGRHPHLSPVSVSDPLHPRAAHEVLRDRLPAVEEAFFAGGPAPDDSDEMLAAYRSAVPSTFLPWLTLCCNDFFVWLQSAQH